MGKVEMAGETEVAQAKAGKGRESEAKESKATKAGKKSKGRNQGLPKDSSQTTGEGMTMGGVGASKTRDTLAAAAGKGTAGSMGGVFADRVFSFAREAPVTLRPFFCA